MRKTLLTLGAASAALVGSASATIIASDDFSYADGNLTGNNGGTGWAGAWQNRSDIVGNLVIDGGDAVDTGVAYVFGDNSGVFDDQGASFRTLAAGITGVSGSVWLTVDMAFTFGKSAESFVSLQFRTGAPPATGDPTDIPTSWRVGDEWTGSTWELGNNFTGTTSSGIQASEDPDALDTLLVHIDYDAGTSSLWVNPAAGALGAADAVSNSTPGAFDTVLMRAGGGGESYRELAMDNLALGTTLADVHVVPEPSSTALLGLAGLALILRRRK